MKQVRPLLVFGKFQRAERTTLEGAAAESAFELAWADSIGDALDWLEAHAPGCILVDARRRDAQTLSLEARLAHAQAPLIALGPNADDLTFADVFNWGGDDLVRLGDEHGLATRLRALPREPAEPAARARGRVVVADPERARRIVLGRVLSNAGYDVSFATNAEDVLDAVRQGDVELVIASSEASSEWPSAIRRVRDEGGSASRWIVTAPPRTIGKQREALAGLDVTVADGYAPAENMLFMANELRSGARQNQRASQRLLYGTTVAFREAGRDADDFGCSYNVSEGGLYVRTLAPPEAESVWLELTPPRSERRVRLVGKVVWRRRFGPNDRATVPAGFGAQIVDGASLDLKAWRAGYQAFLSDVG
jgi:DNA-binding response OmpR family regulator